VDDLEPLVAVDPHGYRLPNARVVEWRSIQLPVDERDVQPGRLDDLELGIALLEGLEVLLLDLRRVELAAAQAGHARRHVWDNRREDLVQARLTGPIVGGVLLRRNPPAARDLPETERAATHPPLRRVPLLPDPLAGHNPEHRPADVQLERGVDILEPELDRALVRRADVGDLLERSLLGRDPHEPLEG